MLTPLVKATAGGASYMYYEMREWRSIADNGKDDGKETSDVFSKAIADYNNIRDNDPTEYDKYKERADAARKKKEEEKNSVEGKIKQIIELCKKQLNDVQALENLGAHVVAYVVFPDGKFCNNSTNKAKQFMEMQNPLFGYTLTSFVHGSSIAPVEWRQPHQDLRSRVQDVINIKYQKALRLFSPGSSGRSFPYRAYHRTGHNAHGHKIHVSGLPSGGTLKDMARYGVADLKEILENKDDIQITLEMSEVSGGDNEMSEVSGGDNEMSEVSGGDNGSNLDLVLDVPVNNNEELGSNLDLVLDVPVNNNEELENTPEDIANLLKEVSKETSKETSGAKKRKGSTSQYTRKTKRGKSKAQKDDKAQYTRKTKRGKSKAQKDDKEFIVEAILGEREKEGGTEYLVKWKGYSAEHNTYEPPAHLENCEIFINYIKNK
ncbi:uncharacterized protein [Amphiura filiformis]|uniref:uncharacterized protein n=1 Tax=Amphiura filiformis TaxID=82378 RepID=UPI003B2130EA